VQVDYGRGMKAAGYYVQYHGGLLCDRWVVCRWTMVEVRRPPATTSSITVVCYVIGGWCAGGLRSWYEGRRLLRLVSRWSVM